MSIASEIKQRLATPGAAATAEQGALAKGLQTKATGRATTGSGARSSAIGSQVATQAAGAAQESVRQQGVVAGERIEAAEAGVVDQLAAGKAELAGQKQAADLARNTNLQMAENARLAQMDESMAKLDANEIMGINRLNAQSDATLKQLESDRGMTLNDIWSSFSRSNDELAFREEAAVMEQLAFDMRLRDTQYVDHITRVGKMRGLQDDLAFKNEASRLIMGEDNKLLIDKLGFQKAWDASERDFASAMATIDIASALSIANSAAQTSGLQAMAKGATKVAEN